MGYSWTIRNQGSSGPGPNVWKDSNVFVDGNGDLHLKISYSPSGWTCAEIYTNSVFPYGTFEWWVIGEVDKLDKNVVLGLFMYPGSGAVDGTNEIDIEFAQWGNANNKRLFYTVYPKELGPQPQSAGFDVQLSGTYTTNRFKWSATGVFYEGVHGHQEGSGQQFASWSSPANFSSQIPSMKLVTHMNLWLFQGRQPSNGKEVEIVIRRFKYY